MRGERVDGVEVWLRRALPVLVFALAVLSASILFGGLQAGPPASAQTAKVGLVTDEATLNDSGFNWLSYQGLLRAEAELGVAGTVYTSTSDADYGPNLQQCVTDGNDLCIAVGFGPSEAISATAAANSDTAFAIVDFEFMVYPDNLRGMIFAGDEVGYLAGALAGMMTQSNAVGCVGGMAIPPVTAFAEPYRNAAQCANPDVTVYVTYTGTFADPDLGAQVAQEMIGKGTDVVFGVGAATGTGAIMTATQSGVWGIGVDTDQYVTTFGNGDRPGAAKVLSSAMKRMDNAVFDTISDLLGGAFTAGTVLYGLGEDGVGLAPFHEAGSDVPMTVRGRLERLRQDIIAGAIDVWGACPEYMIPTYEVVPENVSTEFTAGGGLATFSIDAGTFTQTAVISLTPQVPIDPGFPLVGPGFFFELEAASQATGQSLAPQASYTVTLSYTDGEIAAAGVVDENSLALYFWDGDQWVADPTCVVDPEANEITCTPDHLSLWSLLSPRYALFLPAVMRTYAP